MATALSEFMVDGVWLTGSHTHALDLIGSVTTTPGVYDINGNELTAPVVDGRFHANLRLREPASAAIQALHTAPATPIRVWM